jgi:hypothetical protein
MHCLHKHGAVLGCTLHRLRQAHQLPAAAAAQCTANSAQQHAISSTEVRVCQQEVRLRAVWFAVSSAVMLAGTPAHRHAAAVQAHAFL